MTAPAAPLCPRHLRSIATVCLSGGLADKLDTAARVGFDGVEIFENDLLTYGGPPSEVRRICGDLGLEITIFQPFRDFEAMPDEVRGRNLDRAERKFDVMHQLGTDLVLVCSNVSPASIDDDARAAADLHAMASRAAARGLRVGYEALAWGRNVSRWGHAWRIVQQADHPALGLVVDSFHTLALGDDPAKIADVPGDRLFFVQLADAPAATMDVLSLSRHHRCFPGQGELPVADFLRPVLASGYAGPLSLEVFNDEFRSAPPRMIARDGLRSLALMESQSDLSSVPPPPRIAGVEFLEFAVDPASSAALAGMLGELGFHHAGRHRSKEVDLFRQGDINLVLNREQDSAASEHFQLHGPSVCALALRVDDVALALSRAEAMLCPEWRSPVQEGERLIPAVRAPDGMLIHLVQPDPGRPQSWEDDFELLHPQAGATPATLGLPMLSVIDHMAEALPANALPGSVLFWRAVFGLETSAPVALTDPYGVVRSRAMVSPGGAFRLPLNVSESRETLAGRFVATSLGAGVQHIAFGTLDAAKAATHTTLLPIAANYYEDLAARWALTDAALADLQRHGLLYDRDDDGEFIHGYTRTFERRFFFEIVERRGSQGFGAANAAFRLAAQSLDMP